MAGEKSGTQITVECDPAGGSTYVLIGGQRGHTMNVNRTPIDISNKSIGDFRTLLASQGDKMLDLALDLQYNSDATYLAMRGLFESGNHASFRVSGMATVITFTGMVLTVADTAPRAAGFVTPFTVQSTGSFVYV